MSATPIWFDITAADAITVRRFYAELLGWNIAVDEATNYGVISDDEGSPVGGIGQIGEGNRHPAGVVAYFPVEDVDAAVSAAENLGASIAVAPWEIPGLGRMAVVAGPEGNPIGLMSR
jgi:predicted enzyme related to lactoylglutathione lyase